MLTPEKKYKNSPLEKTHENFPSWDPSQIVERKNLYRIALTRAPETQTRPYFFQKYGSKNTKIQKYKNPSQATPHENLFSWDHARIVERKILYRIALTRAPET